VPRIISVNSFRKGTGKSHTVANLAVLMAAQGQRVGIIDADLEMSSTYYLFGLNEDSFKYSLNDFLLGQCSLPQTAIDVTPGHKTADQNGSLTGHVFLINSIKHPHGDIAKVLAHGNPAYLLRDALDKFAEDFNLDMLLIDTPAGLSRYTLLLMALSRTLCIVMSLDQQDYQGTGVTVEVARKLDVPSTVLIINNVASMFNPENVQREVEQAYHCPVAAVLPHSEELLALGGTGLFVIRYPDHALTTSLKSAVAALMA
jgi:MinD-like ATPase involved in chromosome partitioning or flagellar assembly